MIPDPANIMLHFSMIPQEFYIHNLTYVNMKNKELLKLDYESKVKKSFEIIEDALSQCKKPCVSFSGGKNSLVVLHMLLQFKPDIHVAFVNTTNEFPETVRYVRWLAKEWDLNFIEVKPQHPWNFKKVVKCFGFPKPDRWANGEPHCCYLLKTKPILELFKRERFDGNFTGLSAFESRARMMNFLLKGCMIKTKYIGSSYRLPFEILSVKPIYFWNDDDVWRYIKENNLPVNPVYEKYGIERCGCMLCTGHKNWQSQLAKINPKLLRWVEEKIKIYGWDEGRWKRILATP